MGVVDEEGLEGGDQDEEEEEVWLEALETGNVDERGYIPQKKNPSAMTARQVRLFSLLSNYCFSNDLIVESVHIFKRAISCVHKKTNAQPQLIAQLILTPGL